MDSQSRREIWVLAIDTVLVELPVAIAALVLAGHPGANDKSARPGVIF